MLQVKLAMSEIDIRKITGDRIPVARDDFIPLIENNRSRIRDLSSQVLTVCSLLLPTSFVVVFFAIKETTLKISPIVTWLLFIVIVCLITATGFSIFSSLLPSPSSVTTKFELVDKLVGIYQREHRRVRIAVFFLVLAIILFCVSLAIFAITTVKIT